MMLEKKIKIQRKIIADLLLLLRMLSNLSMIFEIHGPIKKKEGKKNIARYLFE